MTIKMLLYILIVPISIWITSNMRLEHIFKKNQTKAIVMFYVFISLGMAYLVVNFIYDFYEVSSINY